MVNVDAEVRVAVVGAGPQALAVVLALLEREPELRHDLVVFDPDGWLGRWRTQFARCAIEHLRSPGVHHPGPDPSALDRWSRRAGLSSRMPYGIPSTVAFERFCDHLVRDADLTEHVVPTRVVGLTAGGRRSLLRLADGSQVAASHVVLAVNPARRRIPPWAHEVAPAAATRVRHADDVDLRGLRLDGEHVLVVGGGLTAGHLVVGAVARGATVTLCTRRPLRESMFDTDPGWLGPKHLDGFHRLVDPSAKLRACLQARDGGSLPRWMRRQVRNLERTGEVRTCQTDLSAAMATAAGVRVEGDDGEGVTVDRVWLATGSAPDVRAHRLTASLAADHPSPILEGWPVLDPVLRWPGTNVHLVGRPAMLSLGPAAGNLWGCRVAAPLVADHIVSASATEQSPGVPSDPWRNQREG